MRPSSQLPRRAGLTVIAAMAAMLSGCGVDQGVSLIASEQVPVTAQPTDAVATPPATTVPDTTDEQVPTTEAPAELPDVPPPTSPTGSTLPPISEPELLTEIDIADVVNIDENKPARSYDAFVAIAFTDIQRWWGEMYPAVYGQPFEPLAGGIYAGYPERTTELPGCNEQQTTYPDLNQFVAFYCSGDDFMIYDDGDDSLLATLTDNFGPAVMGIVLAHEYGHAIQARNGDLGEFLATIYTEQQADCFSGAWAGQAYGGESPLLRLGDADVRAGLIAMLEVRDPVGFSQFDEGGHGSAFDRVGAFQEGFVLGASRCAELIDDPLPLMPNEFQSSQDLANQGNAPYSCPTDAANCTPAPEFLAEDLNDFWSTQISGFPNLSVVTVDDASSIDCSGVVRLTGDVALCPNDDQVVYVEPDVVELYQEFGDFTLGYFYGIAWSERAQIVEASSLTGEPRALLGDCYTGAWVADITPDAQGNTPRNRDKDGDGELDGISSSPGDLDEAIRMVILFGDAGARVDKAGSAFEKIAAFRVGVLGGLDACHTQFNA